MTEQSYYVILNANAGTALALGISAQSIEETFTSHGMKAEVDARTDRSLDERLADAMASEASVIVAAGGDGTITAVASALVGSDKSLAILPLGTVNALAKDLHVPLNVSQAIAAIATGAEHRIDVGEVNGQIFLHKVVIGLIPGLAAGREHIRGKQTFSAKIGFVRYFFRRLSRAKRLAIAIEPLEGERRLERVQAIAIASNSYDEGLGQFFSRGSLDRGTLTLYVLRHLNAGDFFRLSTNMLLGRWRSDEALSMESINGVVITTKKGLVKVMLDGEIVALQSPLNFSIRPRALSVIVPPEVVTQTTTEAA